MTKRELEEAKKYDAFVQEASEKCDIPINYLRALFSRESSFGLSLDEEGKGDSGHGHGLGQIDDRTHKDFLASGKWKDPRENILYSAKEFRWGYDYLIMRIEWRSKELWRATFCGYNAGAPRVKKVINSGQDPDSITAHKNYGSDCLMRADWYKENWA